MTETSLEPVDILLVDDRQNNLVALKALLERDDYHLVLASSGPEALTQVLKRELAVILLDVAMPGMDGFETASIIREREQSRHVPIVFITASAFEMEHVFRGYSVGAVDYLRKPIDPHALRAKVAVFVELFRQRKQLERQAAQLREAELREQQLLRARAEEALRASESLYQLTFEQAPVGIGHASPDGRITQANRRLCHLLDTDEDALLGRRVDELAARDEQDALRDRLLAVMRGGAGYVGEHRLLTLRQTPVWVELTLCALHDVRGGAVHKLILVVNDVTARKRAELERSRLVRELQEGIRARDDFLSIAAHELRTPITPLVLQTVGLLRELERDDGTGGGTSRDELLRRLLIVNRSTERLQQLIERLLDVTQLTTGTLTLERDDTDLITLTHEIAARLREQAERAGCDIEVRAEGAVHGQWDRLRIDQAVSNLLGNAMKYGAGAPIEVDVTDDEGVARLSVRDHGIGIPKEAQERIFERFERVQSLRNYSGFGLGLWIVRQIVEAHGGHVLVTSDPGQGAEFTVLLPEVPDVFVDTARQRAGSGEARP